MRERPLLLDLFCGAGGAAMGYWRAGFDVVGVDCRPMPRYPFPFVRGDALRPPFDLREFDAIHASPPCQAYSRCRNMPWARRDHPDLLGATLALLARTPCPWVVENVPGAPFGCFVVEICGTVLGLRVRRHRLFAASHLLLSPPAGCRHRRGDLTIAGNRFGVIGERVQSYACTDGSIRHRLWPASKAEASRAMGIDWMTRDELAQAIPPAYTEYLGRQLARVVAAR